jgi:hypothetical protein
LISGAISSIKAAKDIGAAAVAIRDSSMLAGEVVKMNEQLLRAQDSLFSHNAQLLSLQQELFELRDRLRTAETRIAERGRYQLAEVSVGKWVYLHKPDPDNPVASGATPYGRPHYVCQPCFDNGRKVVLQYVESTIGNSLDCSVCKASLYVAEDLPL